MRSSAIQGHPYSWRVFCWRWSECDQGTFVPLQCPNSRLFIIYFCWKYSIKALATQLLRGRDLKLGKRSLIQQIADELIENIQKEHIIPNKQGKRPSRGPDLASSGEELTSGIFAVLVICSHFAEHLLFVIDFHCVSKPESTSSDSLRERRSSTRFASR